MIRSSTGAFFSNGQYNTNKVIPVSSSPQPSPEVAFDIAIKTAEATYKSFQVLHTSFYTGVNLLTWKCVLIIDVSNNPLF